MSLARHFFRELRPLFRMLDEPLTRAPSSFAAFPRTSLFNDPFFDSTFQARVPAVDLSEEGANYLVEAEMPGVKKENINISIGDGGHSLTIEGKTITKSEAPKIVGEQTETSSSESSGTTNAVSTTDAPTQISSERMWSGSSSFTRTIWLPRRVDGSNVSAKLTDGILTIRVPKAEDKETLKINIE